MDNQSDHTSQPEKKSQSNQIPGWVKSICIIVAVVAVSYKFIIGDFNLDFNAFLSLILALFSIFLSAEFYFKATDTSNRFYDNVYKFTKDITELLARIEASFGQQLKTLDDRQCLMNERLYGGKLSEQEISNTKSEIEKREAEKERIIKEYKEEINKLIEDREISEREKNEIKETLTRRDREYETAKEDIEMLRKKLQKSECVSEDIGAGWLTLDNRGGWVTATNKGRWVDLNKKNEIKQFTTGLVFRYFFPGKTGSQIANTFKKIKLSLPDEYLNDLSLLGYYSNGGLTPDGINYFKQIIRELESNRVINDDK